MKLKLSLVGGLAVAAVAVSLAAPASATNGVDKKNAARACTALHTSLGPATFSKLYRNFGACVSTWTHTAHRDSQVANASCRSKPHVNNCVAAKTQALLNAQVTAETNAAKACAAEEASVGVTAFTAKYGTDVKGRNAFGECVSGKVSNK